MLRTNGGRSQGPNQPLVNMLAIGSIIFIALAAPSTMTPEDGERPQEICEGQQREEAQLRLHCPSLERINPFSCGLGETVHGIKASVKNIRLG
jgi:hypothetical protein